MSTTALKKVANELAKLSRTVNKTVAEHLAIKKKAKKAKRPAKKKRRG
jgi:hypothetical protein